MSELPHVHAPQEGIHSLRDFLVHIAVVAIGLLLAIALQQGVESIHDTQERSELRAQLRESLEANAHTNARTLDVLSDIRSYLAQLREVVAERQKGRILPLPKPPANAFFSVPGIAPFEAAKANGAVALLSAGDIRAFNYMALQTDIALAETENYRDAQLALRSFRLRYDPSPSYTKNRIVFIPLPVQLDGMSNAELAEYQSLIANLMGALDTLVVRIHRLETQSRAVLDGATDERDIIMSVAEAQAS